MCKKLKKKTTEQIGTTAKKCLSALKKPNSGAQLSREFPVLTQYIRDKCDPYSQGLGRQKNILKHKS